MVSCTIDMFRIRSAIHSFNTFTGHFIKWQFPNYKIGILSGIGALFAQYLLQHGAALVIYWILDKGKHWFRIIFQNGNILFIFWVFFRQPWLYLRSNANAIAWRFSPPSRRTVHFICVCTICRQLIFNEIAGLITNYTKG